jgi:hypothetical protein
MDFKSPEEGVKKSKNNIFMNKNLYNCKRLK